MQLTGWVREVIFVVRIIYRFSLVLQTFDFNMLCRSKFWRPTLFFGKCFLLRAGLGCPPRRRPRSFSRRQLVLLVHAVLR